MDTRRTATLLFLSGAAALVAETVFLRRLALVLGGSALASTIAVAAYLGGLALGSMVAGSLPRGPRTYAVLELLAASWIAASPLLLAPVTAGSAGARLALGAVWVAVPAVFAGGTWPVLARGRPPEDAVALSAANTTGAVAGVLLATFVGLPGLGVRGTELLASALGATAALGAALGGGAPPPPGATPRGSTLRAEHAAAAFLAAGVCTGLEVWWMRLAAVGLGATVQTTGLVLATFLATLALGTGLGRTWPAEPRRAVAHGLAALGTAALVGGLLWGKLPYLVSFVWRMLGPDAWWTGSGGLLLVAMGGAPIASGLVFAGLVRSVSTERDLGRLAAANGAGSVVGALVCGLWLVPWLEARGTLLLLAGAAALGGALVGRDARWLVPIGALMALEPAWDARLYAVGVHLRISEFADPSPRAIARFVDEGWDLLSYDQGTTGAVAVGRSRATGNVWLSINGKVDASTGDDMPTQVLSGEIPVTLAAHPTDTVVVGLASGVTAGAVLADPRVRTLTILELEPAVLGAEPYFRPLNGSPLQDSRTTLVLDDARAWLSATDRTFDVLVSEPSNPWITGVASLFTLEYWQLLRDHRRPGGVVCQWVQLYGMGTDELRGLLRTFRSVFPDAVLYETIEGSDVLLVSGGDPARAGLTPIGPLLDAAALARVAGDGWLNTDDHPRIEWRAPLYLHADTAPANLALLHGGL